MARCFRCHNKLQGKWKLTESIISSDYGRYLGIDAFFLSSTTSKWVYAYCQPCFKIVCSGYETNQSLTELESGYNALTQERDHLKEQLKQVTAERENLLKFNNTLTQEMDSLKENIICLTEENSELQKQLKDQHNMCRKAKDNIYELPELLDVLSLIKELPKEDSEILTEFGLNFQLINTIEDKQKSTTLEMISAFRKTATQYIDQHLKKLNQTMKQVKDFFNSSQPTLPNLPVAVRDGFTLVTNTQVCELEAQILRWTAHKAEFSEAAK